MTKRLAFAILLLAACRPSPPEPTNNAQAEIPTEGVANALEKTIPPAIKVQIETSPKAAAEIVEQYGDLLEQRRFGDALRLWGDNLPDEAGFVAEFDKYATIRASVGMPGDVEGAAGSIYVDVPLTLSGTLKSGAPFKMAGITTLRRANNVPGSTVEQRRWHIYASELKPVG